MFWDKEKGLASVEMRNKSAEDVETTSQSTPHSTHAPLSPLLIKFLENTPLVNFLYDLFFDEAPDVDNVKEMLNLFALITTLFIGGVYGLIGSVTHDELHSCDEMWTNKTYVMGYVTPGSYDDGNIYADMWYGDRQAWNSMNSGFPSAHFNRNIYLALSLLVTSILCILFVYLGLLSKDYRTSSRRYNAISFEKSWAYLKYAMMIIAVAMIAGILFSFSAFADLVVTKIPNTCPFLPAYQSNNWLCTWQYDNRNVTIVMTVTIIPTFLLLWRGCIDDYTYAKVSANEEHQDGLNLQTYRMLKSVVITNTGDAFDSKYERMLLRSYYLSVTDNCIDHKTFLDLSDEELLKLGVNAMGHRKMILAKAKEMKKDSKSMLS